MSILKFFFNLITVIIIFTIPSFSKAQMPVVNPALVKNYRGTIQFVGNGWGAGGLYITMDSSTQKNGCKDGRFIISPSRPDYKTMAAIATSAFFLKRVVNISSDGCIANWSANVVGVTAE